MLTPPNLSLVELDPEIKDPASLPDRVYATLKHRILTGSMLPAERLDEKAICAEMNVSRTPLREALNRLVHEGLVVVFRYRGYTVTPLTVKGFEELCELRRIVEAGAAALAAERATAADVAKLRALAELQYTPGQPKTYDRYLRANSLFHLELVSCTGNRQLEAIVMAALDRHQRPLYLGLDIGIDAAAATAEHHDIVSAIEAHDPRRALTLMVEHIARAEIRIGSVLKAAGY